MNQLQELDDALALADGHLWDDFKFADTDEDWSVSESSSDSGFYLGLNGIGQEGCNELVPEGKVQTALSKLDLLARNTTSALSLPPFGTDDRNNGSNRMMDDSRYPEWNSMIIKDEVLIKDDTFLKDESFWNADLSTQLSSLLGHIPSDSILDVGVNEDLEYEPPAPVILPTPTSKVNAIPKIPSAPSAGLNKKRKISESVLSRSLSQSSRNVKPSKGPGRAATNGSFSSTSTNGATNPCTSSKASKHTCATYSKRSTSKTNGTHCEFCLEKCDNAENLQKHRLKHILGTNLFKCTSGDCQKQYATGEGLRLHVRNVHLCAKNWQCLAEGCQRSFVRQSDLRMHIIRMHSDIRPYPCLVESCAKSFACHSELRRHVLSCHKLPCPKPDKVKSRTNYVDPVFIQALMKKAE